MEKKSRVKKVIITNGIESAVTKAQNEQKKASDEKEPKQKSTKMIRKTPENMPGVVEKKVGRLGKSWPLNNFCDLLTI